MTPLPERPRLRVSFWYEGAALRCELVLMSERRELVHRETFEVTRQSTLEQVHAGLVTTAGRLALAKGEPFTEGEPVEAGAPAAEALEPEPSADNELARRTRLEELAAEAERRAAEMPVEPEEPPPWEPEAPTGPTPEERFAELRARGAGAGHPQPISGDTLIENREPPPPSEPSGSSREGETEAEP